MPVAASLRRAACCLLLIGGADPVMAFAGDGGVQFNRQIRPLLSAKCLRCHGPDRAARQGDLRLDEREAALAARDGQPAIVPGRPDESALIARITAADASLRMPPVETGQTLSAQEVQLLRTWIQEGAAYQPHWAWLAPVAAAPPDVSDPTWPRNPLDRFVLARLDQEGLRPTAAAAPATWLRRATLDLTGLPPTPDELSAFLADDSSAAVERVVDRLLASPAFGERMAVDWLDAGRYADTNGYFSDLERQQWRWRDGVIDAFNRNQPFDQFTIEQLAGDLLPAPTQEQLIATGFHRNQMVTNETGIIDEEYRVEYVADRVDTTATVWLGLTAGCARCHDHKYDPLTQQEYYQLFAFFNNGPETGLVSTANPPPVLPVPTMAHQEAQRAARVRREDAERAYQAVEPALQAAQTAWEMRAVAEPHARPDSGLLNSYSFEERLSGEGVGGADLVPHGVATYEAGIRGTALAFPGELHAELPVGAGPRLDAAWACSLWVRPGTASLGCLLARTEPEHGAGFELLWKKSKLTASFVRERGVSAVDITTAKTLPIEQWHHVVVSYDGSGRAAGLRFYVDGVAHQAAHDEPLEQAACDAQPWRLGRRDGGLGFRGRLDELRFYSRPLTDDDVAALYWGELLPTLLQTPAEKRDARQKQLLFEHFLARHAAPEARAAWERLAECRKKEAELAAAIPTTLVMRELEQPRETFVLVRGEYDKRGVRVRPGVPAALPPLPADAPPNRLGLARWLVSRDQPLTARVTVNRLWARFFGAGLVRTTNDFGSQGEWPSHPELLDWLAVRFRDSGWDVKTLCRLIVTSATYRQSSAATPALLERDPENRLLARGARYRLPAEVIRDQALAASGLLVDVIGGPSVKPYQPAGLWEAVSYDGDATYVEDRGAGLYRRSLYTYWKRQAPPPSMLTFDGPTRETCTVNRPRTNTPLQALVLLNDPTYVEAARVLAQDAQRASAAPARQIATAFVRALARPPRREELESLVALYARQRAEYAAAPDAAQELLHVGHAPADGQADPVNLAALTTVVSVLLNLDETISRP